MAMTQKWISALLCIALMLGLSMGALSEEALTPSIKASLAAGREVTASANFTWHSPPLFDEETNLAITRLLESMRLTARYAEQDAPNAYGGVALELSGVEAVTLDFVTTEDSMYIVSPLLGEPVAIAGGEIGMYMANLGAYMDRYLGTFSNDVMMGGTYEDMFAQLAEYFGPTYGTVIAHEDYVPTGEADAALPGEDIADMYGLAETMQAVAAWLEADMQGESFEGMVETHLGVLVDHATVYTITREKLLTLLDMIEPTLADNDVLWEQFVQLYNQQISEYDTPMTAEELMETLPEAFATLRESLNAFTDDMDIHYKACYDASGEQVLGQVVCDVPSEYEPVALLIEWVPQCLPFYASLAQGEEAYVLEAYANEPLADGREDKGFTVRLDMMSYGELSGTAWLVVNNAMSVTETTRVWDAGIMAGYEASGFDMFVDLRLNQVDVFRGEDVEKKIAMDLSMFSQMSDETIPIISMDATVQTGAAQGAAFSASDESVAFVHPARMDAEAFDAFMTGVSASTLQTAMYVISLLPVELVEVVMGQMTTVMP